MSSGASQSLRFGVRDGAKSLQTAAVQGEWPKIPIRHSSCRALACWASLAAKLMKCRKPLRNYQRCLPSLASDLCANHNIVEPCEVHYPING